MKSHRSRPLAFAATLLTVLVVLLAVAASAAQAQHSRGSRGNRILVASTSSPGGPLVVGWGHPSTGVRVPAGSVLTGPRGGAALIGVGGVSSSSGFTVGQAIAGGALLAFLVLGILYGVLAPRRTRPALVAVPGESADSEQERKAA